MSVGKNAKNIAAKLANAALSIALAMGMTPAGAYAYAETESADGAPASSYLIVKAPNSTDVAHEPVIAELDGAYLLSFGSASEAEAAYARLKGAGVTVEFDRATFAAQPHARQSSGEGIAYAPGEDPFTLAAASIAAVQTPDVQQPELPQGSLTSEPVPLHAMKADASGTALLQASPEESDEATDQDDVPISKEGEPESELQEPACAEQDDEDVSSEDNTVPQVDPTADSDEKPNQDDSPAAGFADSAADGESPSSTKDADGTAEQPPASDADDESAPAETQEPGASDPLNSGKTKSAPIQRTVAIIDSGAPQDELATEAVDLTGKGSLDAFGQATAVVDKIREIAPDARVISIRVLDGTGIGTVAAAYAGIKTAIAHKPDIIDISLCAPSVDGSPILASAISEAQDAGIVVVSAAGDEGADAAAYSPANAPGSITVGSCDAAGTRLETSNLGACVQLYACAPSTAVAAATASGWIAAHSDLTDARQDLLSQCGSGVFFPSQPQSSAPIPDEEATQLHEEDAPTPKALRLPKTAGKQDAPLRSAKAASLTIRVSTDSNSYFLFDSKGTGTAFRWSGPKVSAAGTDHSNDKNVGTITYCINPHYSYDGILFGNQTAHRASVADFGSQTAYQLALAALYYGYGGPGYNGSTGNWYPATQYDGTALTGKYRFSTTHVLLGSLYMGSIDKTDVSSSYRSWFSKHVWKKGKPRANGTYAKTLLAHYNDADMVSAGGYTIDEWERSAYIIDTGPGHQDLMTFIPMKKGAVKLVKQSERPKVTNGSSKYSLKGAVYGVFETKAKAQTHKAANAIATYKTNAKGKFITDDILTVGEPYWIAEIEPSRGYGLDASVHKAVASSKEVKVVKSTEDVRLEPVSVTLGARKTLSGRTLRANEFSFQLKDSRGRVLQTKRNTADGTVSFDAIEYEDPDDAGKTFTYQIAEVKGKDPGIVYDTHVETVTLKVTERSNKLVAELRYSGTGNAVQPTFKNKIAETSGVRVKKVDADTSAPLDGATFAVFSGTHADRASALASGNPVKTMTSGADGIASASGLKPGAYTVVELHPPSGYAVDESWCESFDARTTEIADLTGSPARDARTRGSVTLTAEKELAGGEIAEGQFTFELTPVTAGAPMPADAHDNVSSAVNGSDGHVAFGKIEYGDAHAGHTYRYRIREVAGQDARIEYSGQSYFADVKVMRNASGIVTETTYALEDEPNRATAGVQPDAANHDAKATYGPQGNNLLLAVNATGLRAADSGIAKGNTVTINLTGVGDRTYYTTAAYSWKTKGTTAYTLKVVVGIHKRSDWYNSPLSGSVSATGQEKQTFSGNKNAATTGTDIELKTYTFTWNRAKSDADKDVTVKVSRTYNGVTYTSTAKFTVTVPALASYAIAYNGNGSTSGSVSGQTKWYGEDLALRANGYKRTGYTFAKWNTKADGSGTSYNAGAAYKANAKATLYAQWTANTYRVRYLGNGATGGSMPDSTHTYGAAKNLTANGYTREYHAFVNWNTKADGTGTSYTNRQSVKNLTATNNGMVTLYAIWKPNVPEDDATYGKATFTNRVKQRCGAHALKTDAETGRPLAGCVFEIQPGLAELGVPGELFDADGTQVESLSIVSQADGVASTPEDALSTGGLFRIREVAAPEGYALGDAQWRYFTSGEAEGQFLEIGEWADERLRTTATISAVKSYVMKTGPSTETAHPILEDEFAFELLEGDEYLDAQVVSTAYTPASPDGVSTVAFPELVYTADDVGTHTYWIRESAGLNSRIAYDTAPRKVTVAVSEVPSPQGTSMLQATVAYHSAPDTPEDAVSDEPPTIQNVLHPGFDVRVFKHGANAAGADSPLGGAVFAIFEIPPLGNGASPAIPAVFTDREEFQAAFAIDEAGSAYSYDAGQIESEHGVRFVESIVSGRDGYAASEDAALESGKAYAIVEVRAPAGYLLADPRTNADAKTPICIIDDLTPNGVYAHVGGHANQGADIGGQPDGLATSGFEALVGETSANAVSRFSFANERDDRPRGGLAVRKVSAETGTPLAGARFAIYPEGEFARVYADWRSHVHADEDDSAFLDAIGESFTYDTLSGRSSENPYYLKPLEVDLEPTGPDGWTATGDSALPVGDYRVVEVSAPTGFEIPPYDFSDSSGAAANVHVVVTQDEITRSDTAFQDPAREPREASAPIVAKKALSRGSLSAGQFEFALCAEGEEAEITPLATARNAEDGAVALATFRFSEANGGAYDLLGPNGEVLESGAGQPPDTPWRYALREIVPADATCSIDGETWTYGEYAAEYGLEDAAPFPWSCNGVAYDASLLPVEVSVDANDSEAGPSIQVSYPEGNSFENAVDTDGLGGLRVMKADEHGEGIPGAVFEITGTTAEGATYALDIISDDDGIAETARDALPLGTYAVREKTAPAGYLINGEWTRQFSIEEEGQLVDFSGEDADWCIDKPDNSPIHLPITGGPGLMLPTALALTTLLLGTRQYAKTHPKPNPRQSGRP